jgi:hypothetical protein
MLSGVTSDRRRLHTPFSKRRRNGQELAETQSRDDHFKPVRAELGQVTNAGCNYTKSPEVKGLTNSAPVLVGTMGQKSELSDGGGCRR